MTGLSEFDVEAAALGWLSEAGWALAFGPDIAPDMPGAERAEFGEVVLAGRLRAAGTFLALMPPISTYWHLVVDFRIHPVYMKMAPPHRRALLR